MLFFLDKKQREMSGLEEHEEHSGVERSGVVVNGIAGDVGVLCVCRFPP